LSSIPRTKQYLAIDGQGEPGGAAFTDKIGALCGVAFTVNGLRFRGRHHEIYLSDPRRVPAERLKTILRHPIERS